MPIVTDNVWTGNGVTTLGALSVAAIALFILLFVRPTTTVSDDRLSRWGSQDGEWAVLASGMPGIKCSSTSPAGPIAEPAVYRYGDTVPPLPFATSIAGTEARW